MMAIRKKIQGATAPSNAHTGGVRPLSRTQELRNAIGGIIKKGKFKTIYELRAVIEEQTGRKIITGYLMQTMLGMEGFGMDFGSGVIWRD